MPANESRNGPLPCAACGWPPSAGTHCTSCGAPVSGEVRDPYVGLRVGDRYEVGELICVGGMGRVYRGVQIALARPVAIKFVHPYLLQSENVLRRFMIEARAASRLNHPNVVRVLDFGQLPDSEGAAPYTVMELLSGASLADVLNREGKLAVDRAVGIVQQVLAALDEAHSQGVIHRDIKPENVVIEHSRARGEFVKVIDFGLARVGGTSRITTAGATLGTPGFMAPEQMRGDEPAPAADLYAVGVMLYEAVTGSLPFAGDTAAQIAIAQLSSAAPDPREIAADLAVTDAFVAVLRRALAPDPSQRFASAGVFSRALTDSLRVPVSGPRPQVLPAALRPTQPAATATTDRSTESLPLLERDADLAWARGWLVRARPGDSAVLWGHAGSGRSRLIREIVAIARQAGTRVVSVAPDPLPAGRARYRGVADFVSSLLGWGSDAARRAQDALGASADVAAGLRAMFSGDAGSLAAAAERKAAAGALDWALARATALAVSGRPPLLALDDFDRMDTLSQSLLADAFATWNGQRFLVLATVESGGGTRAFPAAERREVKPISAPAAVRASPGLADVAASTFDALYLDHWRRFTTECRGVAVPGDLGSLIRARLIALDPVDRRTLEALAILGRADAATLRRVGGESIAPPSSLQRLCDRGFLRLDAGAAVLANAAVGHAVRASLGSRASRELHLAASLSGPIEVRAYHSLRGPLDLGAYLLVERAVDELAARGDGDGVERMLADAVAATRSEYSRTGHDDAGSAWLMFARRLAEHALAAGDVASAYALLSEVLDSPACDGVARGKIMSLHAQAAARRRASVAPSPDQRELSARPRRRTG